MADWPAHHCPGCGAAQRAFPRYPWFFCRDCLARATDGEGQALAFFNVSPSGGLGFRCHGAEGWWEAQPVLCLIDRRPVLVHEARFGGVVAEPLRDVPQDLGPRGIDTRRRTWTETAAEHWRA